MKTKKEIKPPCGGHDSGIGNRYRCWSWACQTVSRKRRYESMIKDAMAQGILTGMIRTENGFRSEHLEMREVA